MTKRKLWVLAALALPALGAGGQDAADTAERFDGIQTFSKPSRDAIMGFSVPTRVVEVLARGGQRVTEGTLIARGQDGEQVAIVKQTRMRAETDAPVRRAQKQADLADTEYRRAADAQERGGVTELEVERAKLTWEVSLIDLETAKMNADLENIRLEQAEALLSKYRIVAPFDGTVDQVLVDVGRSVGDTEPVVRIVATDPVWIDVPAPTDQTVGLEAGAKAWVLVETPGEPSIVVGEVIEVSPVADYASASRRVRVSAPNPEDWPPGLRVWVRFTEPEGDWTITGTDELSQAAPSDEETP